jgi:hypothetical protein
MREWFCTCIELMEYLYEQQNINSRTGTTRVRG